MKLSIEAFHGTSLRSAQEIERTNFNESCKDDEWLGRGIYFFVAGISDPHIDASEWAKAQAWDKNEKTYKYAEFGVLSSVIEIEESHLIDLTDQLGIQNFNKLKDKFLDAIFNNFNSARLREMSAAQHNCAVFNYIVATVRTHAIRHRLYIKNTKERKLNLKLNIPNCTVLCIRKANFKSDVKMVSEGKIV